MTLDLELEEINFLLFALGELPTKSNAWNLATKIKAQGDAQVPPEEPKEHTVTTTDDLNTVEIKE